MSTRDKRRDAAIEQMANYILREGLSAATLRPLAAAAGTSDRMLLYYFSDREEILSLTLQRIAERMLNQLDEAVPIRTARPFGVLLEEVRQVLARETIKPFMTVWLDLAAAAGRGLEPHRQIAGEIADGFLGWISARLKAMAHTDGAGLAALFMIAIEGMHVLEAVGRANISVSAAEDLLPRIGRHQVVSRLHRNPK